MVILFVSISLLIVPDLTHTSVLGQSDKSFKGTTAPFVPPSSSERLGLLSENNFEFEDDKGVEGDETEEEEEEEIDRDELPLLTKQERDEFLSDNTDAIEADRLTVLSDEGETVNEDIDPISSIVEEIVKNETIIGDEEFVPSPQSSILKFKDQDLEQILNAQEVAPDPDNQTISTTEEEEEDDLPLNVTEDDFEIEQADEISESESPDVNVQSFINETATEEAAPAPTDNETAITTTEDTVEEEAAPSPTDNETAITTTEDTVEEEEQTDEAQTSQEEQQQTEQAEEEEQQQTEQAEEEEQQQTEQAEEEEQTDEAQTSQEGSPNAVPIAQDSSVTTSQNQQLNIKLNANDADGDNLSFTIVNEPSNGQLGSIDQSTNTVTYTPPDNYSGKDNFTFIVNDGSIDSNEATVSIIVEEEQQQTEQAEDEEQTDEAETSQEEEAEVEEEEEEN
ncbi:MAG TPA: Ig-like domain-containing protein [Nitrososphaeraceae archaeon]